MGQKLRERYCIMQKEQARKTSASKGKEWPRPSQNLHFSRSIQRPCGCQFQYTQYNKHSSTQRIRDKRTVTAKTVLALRTKQCTSGFSCRLYSDKTPTKKKF